MKNKNTILWIEAFFAAISMWILFTVEYYPERAHTALRIYVFAMLLITIGMVIAVRYYQSQHSSVDIDRICEMVRHIDVPAFIWSNDLTTMYTNEAMDELLGIAESEDPGDIDVLLTNFFHSLGIAPRNAADVLSGHSYYRGIEDEDGNTRYISWTTSLLKHGSRASLYFSIGFETTDLVETQQDLNDTLRELSKSESRYALSMKLSGIGILLCESNRDEYYVSDEAMKFLGISENRITFSEFRKRLHPEDRLIFDDYLNKVRYSTPQRNSTKPRTLELRIRPNNSGQYTWYSYHYHENLANKDGMPIIGGALIDISVEKAKDATIERLAFLDEITEIANRNKLMHDGEETFRICRAMGTYCWILVLDIDRFHIINDSYGYENGDKILKQFAHVLCKYTAAGGFAARVSADNFAMVLHDYSDYGDDELPGRTLEHIRADLQGLSIGEFANLSLSCSAGFARIPTDGNSFHEVLEHAEFALAMGKGELAYVMGYDAQMHREIVSQGEMEKQLATAIRNHYLQLYYQPKYDLKRRCIMGAEALIRWITPDGNMISPNVFIPIAEKTGMISDISHFVLVEAVRQNAEWQKAGLSPIVMSINFASGDFYQANICDTVGYELERRGLESKWLELELTERLALGDINYTVQQMNALRDMGILLAMDDFGTGYSSLSYIQLLPLTLLKLDRSFIIEIETDTVAQEIVSAVIKIAKSMNIETIAEGVEYQGQSDLLARMGCDYIQGYLYGKPMTAADFRLRLIENTPGYQG